MSAALSAMRWKTDRNNACAIAWILQTGWFSPIHMKSREAHGVRALRSNAKTLLSKTIDLARKMHRLSKVFGIRLPKTIKHSSCDGVFRPRTEMGEVLAQAILPLLDARLVLYQHVLELDRRVRRAARQDEVYMRLMRTKGRRRAVVAVARKLAVLLHHIKADGSEFRSAKAEGMA
ncbi:MAG: hypothetical protein AAF367_15760 [Pseudomonadota bacterium]